MIFPLTVILCNRGWLGCCEGCFQVWVRALLASLLHASMRCWCAPFPFSDTWLSIGKKFKHATDKVTFQNYFSSLNTILLDKHPLSHAINFFAFLRAFCAALKRSQGLMCLWKFSSLFFLQKGDIAHKGSVKTIIFHASLFAHRPDHVTGVVVLITRIWALVLFRGEAITILKSYSRVTVLSLPRCAFLLWNTIKLLFFFSSPSWS